MALLVGRPLKVLDMIMMRIVDIIYSLPDMLLIILLAVVLNEVLTPLIKGTVLSKLGVNMIALFIVFGCLYWVGMARLIRGQILTIKQNEYILAARCIGTSSARTIRKHILPNCLSVIIITTALQIPSAIFTESYLSFIGLGVSAPMPSLGSLANTGLNQGNTILLNIFFGPLANAAFGVATQIQNAFNSLSNSIVLPFRPPMIKAYAEGDHESVNSMFQANNKVICYFMLAVGLPIIAEMRTILQLWLGMNDNMTVIFSQMMVASVIVISLHNPISIIIHATGRVRQYHVPVESLILLCFPVTLILFKSGCQAVVLFYSMLGLVVVAHCVRIYILRRSYPQFSLTRYVRAFLLPASIVAACSSAITYAVHCSVQGDIPRMVVVFTLAPSAVMLLAYTIGITGSERKLANRFLTKTFRKKTDDIID